jgi:hypothetical protein
MAYYYTNPHIHSSCPSVDQGRFYSILPVPVHPSTLVSPWIYVCTGCCRQTAKGEHRWRGNLDYLQAGATSVACVFSSPPGPDTHRIAWRNGGLLTRWIGPCVRIQSRQGSASDRRKGWWLVQLGDPAQVNASPIETKAAWRKKKRRRG